MTHFYRDTPSMQLRGISSMATRQILAAITAQYAERSGVQVQVESVGGVDAAKRIQAGESFDLVLLASDAIDRLIASGHAVADSRVDWAVSGVAACVKAGQVPPDFSSETAVKQAVLNAKTLGYSTGPSGVQLAKLFERWAITEQIQSRIITAPPGVPVASLVAKGEIELGFQQLSELMGVAGIDILPSLPVAIQINTVFSSALVKTGQQTEAAKHFQMYLHSHDTTIFKEQYGMKSS